jgi:F-type H+-transporting ATPase subunit b
MALVFMALAAYGQNSGATADPATSDPSRERVSDRPVSAAAQLAHESREAAGTEQGESDELKKSPSVRLVARLTGTSLQHAYWLCMLLNFVIIAAAILWISRLHLPAAFRSRTQSIQSAMQEARKATEDANRRLAQIESRLSKLGSEISAIQTTAEQEAAAEEARIQAAAEEDRRKIVDSAQQEIAAAAKAARRDLKRYAADLAVELAQQQIRVDPTMDRGLVQSFAEELGTEANGTGKDGR